jgi:hypothetical protein
MPSNLFFILIFNLILLIIIFCVIDFVFQFYLSTVDLLGIGHHNFFFYLWCFRSNDKGNRFEKLMQFWIFFFSYFFYDFIILHIFLKKIGFIITFNFIFIGLSWSHNLDHKFCRLLLNEGFF